MSLANMQPTGHMSTAIEQVVGSIPHASRVTVASGESKVHYLNLTTVVHQKVGLLEISVQDPIFMTMSKSGE